MQETIVRPFRKWKPPARIRVGELERVSGRQNL